MNPDTGFKIISVQLPLSREKKVTLNITLFLNTLLKIQRMKFGIYFYHFQIK